MSDEAKAVRSSDRKQREGFYDTIHNYLPGKIHMASDGRHRSLINIGGTPHLILNPSWEGSWMDTPKALGGNSIGVWPAKTKFPGTAENILVPAEFKHKLPLKFDFHIQSPELRTYLEAPRMTDNKGSIRVNPVVFESSSFALSKNHFCPIVDKFLKDQLADNLITDEFIDMTDNLVRAASHIPTDNPGLDTSAVNALLIDKLNLIRKSVLLSSANNLRGRHNILSGIVRNKLVLREEVLRAHWGGAGSDNTKEALLGSSFFSPDLFGPVPESISQNCVRNPSLILKPRKTSSAKDNSPAQSSPSTSSAFAEHESPATDTAVTPSNKKVKSSPNQEFRSNTNHSRARHKGSSSFATNKKGHH